MIILSLSNSAASPDEKMQAIMDFESAYRAAKYEGRMAFVITNGVYMAGNIPDATSIEGATQLSDALPATHQQVVISGDPELLKIVLK